MLLLLSCILLKVCLFFVSLPCVVACVACAYVDPISSIRGEQMDRRCPVSLETSWICVSGHEDTLSVFVSSLKLCIVLTGLKFT